MLNYKPISLCTLYIVSLKVYIHYQTVQVSRFNYLANILGQHFYHLATLLIFVFLKLSPSNTTKRKYGFALYLLVSIRHIGALMTL